MRDDSPCFSFDKEFRGSTDDLKIAAVNVEEVRGGVYGAEMAVDIERVKGG